jgi:hypothetical protein
MSLIFIFQDIFFFQLSTNYLSTFIQASKYDKYHFIFLIPFMYNGSLVIPYKIVTNGYVNLA